MRGCDRGKTLPVWDPTGWTSYVVLNLYIARVKRGREKHYIVFVYFVQEVCAYS